MGGGDCSTSRYLAICAPRMAEGTVARHRAWLPFVSFSVVACTNGEDGKEFQDDAAMDAFEDGSDYHERTRIGSVCSQQGRVRVYIGNRLHDMARLFVDLIHTPRLYKRGSIYPNNLPRYNKLNVQARTHIVTLQLKPIT